jgi:predicted nucleic acid-binding protein
MYLLDTNVVSELRRPDRADRAVKAWIDGADQTSLFLSVVSVLELETGALRKSRNDPKQGALLKRWIESRIIPTFADRILAIDLAIARRCAALHVPDPRGEGDALIAATALVHGLTVVTRNVADFVPMGVEVFNPWRMR